MRKLLLLLLLTNVCFAGDVTSPDNSNDIKQIQIDSVNMGGKHIKPKMISTSQLNLYSGSKLYLDGGGDSYLYEASPDVIYMVVGGAGRFFFQTDRNYSNKILAPASDNTFSCGDSSYRWTAVYAVNGTIQTSVSSTKEDIEDLTIGQINSDIKGATFKRKEQVDVYKKDLEGKKIKDAEDKDIIEKKEILTPDMLGFMADGLPEEAFALEYDKETDTWARSNENIYTGAVIGILCERVKKLETKNIELEKRIEKLEK